jgi:hypothetical protein
MKRGKQRRLYPDFQTPLPRFDEQYDRLVQLSLVAEKMHQYGVRVDTGRALKHAQEATARAGLFTDMFVELTGLKRGQLGEKGEGTTKAVRDWFCEAGAPDVVFDKVSKKAQFNAAALTCWASDYAGKPFAAPAAALLGLRKAKVGARFARSYYEVATHHDGRIHFDFNVLGTKGERWSASAKFRWHENGETIKFSLNAQNVPAKKTKYDFGSKYGVLPLMVSLRDCFIPAPGTVWAKFDYEGAEGTLIALNSGDQLLLNILASNSDIHTETAKRVFLEDKIPAELRKLEKGHPLSDRRDASKPMLYGLSYQAPSTKGDDKYPELWKQWKSMFPHLTETYFKLCVDRFFGAYSGIRRWQYGTCVQVDSDGYVALPQNGKLIYVSQTAKGKNMSLNFFMQSGLGFLINRAIPPIAAACDWRPDGLALLLQVHDELDLQIPIDRLDEVCAWVSEELSKPADFGGHFAGISAAPDVGDSWGTVKPK